MRYAATRLSNPVRDLTPVELEVSPDVVNRDRVGAAATDFLADPCGANVQALRAAAKILRVVVISLKFPQLVARCGVVFFILEDAMNGFTVGHHRKMKNANDFLSAFGGYLDLRRA